MANQHKLTNTFLGSIELGDEKQREIRDTSVPSLRALILKRKIVLIVRKCFQNHRHYKRIAEWPFPLDKARQIAIQFGNDIETGQLNDMNDMTISEFYHTIYIPYLKAYKTNTGPEQAKFRKWILPFLGSMRLRELRRIDVEKVLQIMSATCANSSVNRLKSGISKLLSLAVEHEVISKNVAASIRKLPEDNIRYRVLTPMELAAFIASCEADEDRMRADAILLCLYLGLRATECYSLTIQQVDANLSSVLLTKTKSKRHHRVYLNSPAREVIRRRLSEAWNDQLFPSVVNEGRHMSPPYEAFIRICKRAGVSVRSFKGSGEPLVIHDLRRTWAHYCLAQADMNTTSKMMNHANTAITAERYAHYKDQHLIDVSEKVGSSMLKQEITI